MSARKLYPKLLTNVQNVRFADFCKVVEAFGYRLDRIRGSQHIYEQRATPRPLDIQNCRARLLSAVCRRGSELQ